MRPDSSTCLMLALLPRKPWCKAWGVKTASNGSTPKLPSSLRATGSASPAGAYTTAPKRRGSCRRNMPWSVCKSIWSCTPAAGKAGAKRKLPDMPRCSSSKPWDKSSNKYLPRLRTANTCWPCSTSGAAPKGQRKGLPRRRLWICAPAIPPAKDRRVTSTSGNSGMAQSFRVVQALHYHAPYAFLHRHHPCRNCFTLDRRAACQPSSKVASAFA